MKIELSKKSCEFRKKVKSMNYVVMLFADEGTKSNGTSACQASMVPHCKKSSCRSI